MAIDRVSRKKNREQDARLDDLTKLVDGLDADLHDEDGVLDQIVNLTTRANQTDNSIGEIDRDIALLTQRVAALEAAQQPTDPPPPPDNGAPFGLPLAFAPKAPEDWTRVLVEKFAGDIGGANGKFWVKVNPNQSFSSNGRMEFHELGAVPIPSEVYYEVGFTLPSGIVLTDSDHGQGWGQLHGDENPGYTGGPGILSPDGESGIEQFRIRLMDMGKPNPLPFGRLIRGFPHKVGFHVRWSAGLDGWMRCYLDGKLGREIKGQTAAAVSGRQMWRLGAYTSDSGPTGIDYEFDNPRCYVRVG